MKIQCRVCDFSVKNGQNCINFRGTPQRIYGMNVKNYQDALNIWEKLRYAKYLDAHQNSWYDKSIRADNYSFLDKLNSYSDKTGFIEKFCSFTGFPNLRTVSDKIDSTFKNCINRIARDLNSRNLTSGYDIIDSGYDPTCSLGLRKAFPGSDLDKGYIILAGNEYNSAKQEENIVNNFKGRLWDELDQRIVSLNHPDTFPSVYTKSQVKNMLSGLDETARKVQEETTSQNIRNNISGSLLASFLGPWGIALTAIKLLKKQAKQAQKIALSTDPYEAGEFNRKIAQKISTAKEREDVKNFAFFIEMVKANLVRNPSLKNDSIFTAIKISPFVKNSNVTQVEAWLNKINGGYMKSKLRSRMALESDFYSMSTDTKYDLIKDVIKYCTDDQSSRFSKYFKNDDDIANRYEKLLQSLR